MSELRSAGAAWATVHEFAALPGDELPSGDILHTRLAGDEDGIHCELVRADRLRFDADGAVTLVREPTRIVVLNGANDVASFEVLPTREGVPVLSALTPAERETARELIDELRAALDAEDSKPAAQYGLNARYGLSTTAVQRKTREPSKTADDADW